MKKYVFLSVILASSLFAENNETFADLKELKNINLINGSYKDCLKDAKNCQSIKFSELRNHLNDFQDHIACMAVNSKAVEENAISNLDKYDQVHMLINQQISTSAGLVNMGINSNLEYSYFANMKWYKQGKLEEKFQEFDFDTTGEIAVYSKYNNAPYGLYLTEQLNLEEEAKDASFRAWYDVINTRMGNLHDEDNPVNSKLANSFSKKNDAFYKALALYKNFALYDTVANNPWGFIRTGKGSLLGKPVSYGGDGYHIVAPEGGLSKCYFVNMAYYADNKTINNELERFKYSKDKNIQDVYQVASPRGARNFYYYTIDKSNIANKPAPYRLSVNTRALSMRNNGSLGNDLDLSKSSHGGVDDPGRFGLSHIKDLNAYYAGEKTIKADITVKFYPDADESLIDFVKEPSEKINDIYAVDNNAQLLVKFKNKGKYLLNKDRNTQSFSIYDCGDKWGFCSSPAAISYLNLNSKRSLIVDGKTLKIDDKTSTIKNFMKNNSEFYGAKIDYSLANEEKCREDQLVELSVTEAEFKNDERKRVFFDEAGRNIIKGNPIKFQFIIKGDINAPSCNTSKLSKDIVSVWNKSNTTPLLNQNAILGDAVYTRVEGGKIYVALTQESNKNQKIKFLSQKPDKYIDANGFEVVSENGFYPLTKGVFVYDNLKSGIHNVVLAIYDNSNLEVAKSVIYSNDFSVRPAKITYDIKKEFKAGKSLKIGGLNEDLNTKLYDLNGNVTKLDDLHLNKADLKVKNYEFKLETNGAQIDENNSSLITANPINININYPFASSVKIIFDTDYKADKEPLCRANEKSFDDAKDNKLINGKVACNIPSENEINVDFILEDNDNIKYQKHNNINSNAVFFSNYKANNELKDKVNALVLTGYISQNNVKDYVENEDFKNVYKEFKHSRKIEFDLKFDNKNVNAQSRYIHYVDSKLESEGNIDVKNTKIKYIEEFGLDRLNDKFDNKLAELYSEYSSGKKLSEIADKYEGEGNYYTVDFALAYKKSFANESKKFNLTSNSKIILSKDDKIIKEFSLAKQPFVYAEMKIKDMKGNDNILNNVDIGYIDENGKKQAFGTGGISYTKNMSDVMKTTSFISNYGSSIDVNTGKITKSSKLQNTQYTKEKFYYKDSSEIEGSGEFTVEF